jgi:hypothetical protein
MPQSARDFRPLIVPAKSGMKRLIPRERRFHLAGRLHAEFLIKIEDGAPLQPRFEAYPRLPADFIRALRGDRLPEPRPVAGGRFRDCSNTREVAQPESTAAA